MNGQLPAEDLVRILRTQPDAIIAPNFNDDKIIEILCDQANNNQKMVVGNDSCKGSGRGVTEGVDAQGACK